MAAVPRSRGFWVYCSAFSNSSQYLIQRNLFFHFLFKKLAYGRGVHPKRPGAQSDRLYWKLSCCCRLLGFQCLSHTRAQWKPFRYRFGRLQDGIEVLEWISFQLERQPTKPVSQFAPA